MRKSSRGRSFEKRRNQGPPPHGANIHPRERNEQRVWRKLKKRSNFPFLRNLRIKNTRKDPK
jgi:hypothetical protein